MDVENALSSSCSSILVSDQKFEQDKQDSLINGVSYNGNGFYILLLAGLAK